VRWALLALVVACGRVDFDAYMGALIVSSTMGGLASEYCILGTEAQIDATFTWQSPGSIPTVAAAFR